MLVALKKVEKHMNMKLGDPSAPLLVSVRSGAAVSMPGESPRTISCLCAAADVAAAPPPGMMDTVLNLGLNDAVVEGLAKKAGDRFAYDSYSATPPPTIASLWPGHVGLHCHVIMLCAADARVGCSVGGSDV